MKLFLQKGFMVDIRLGSKHASFQETDTSNFAFSKILFNSFLVNVIILYVFKRPETKGFGYFLGLKMGIWTKNGQKSEYFESRKKIETMSHRHSQ